MKKLNDQLSKKIKKKHFENISDLEEELKNALRSNDIILVKGSHSIGLNSLVKNISGSNNDI